MAMTRSLGAGIVEPPSSGAVSGIGVPSAAGEQQSAGQVDCRSRSDLGGFAAAVLAVISCYIRVTRKQCEEKA
ncbi:unnamed protein product [Musa hybrid cultivar]